MSGHQHVFFAAYPIEPTSRFGTGVALALLYKCLVELPECLVELPDFILPTPDGNQIQMVTKSGGNPMSTATLTRPKTEGTQTKPEISEPRSKRRRNAGTSRTDGPSRMAWSRTIRRELIQTSRNGWHEFAEPQFDARRKQSDNHNWPNNKPYLTRMMKVGISRLRNSSSTSTAATPLQCRSSVPSVLIC